MLSSSERPVVIVGAGIVGLCCAYYLRRSGREVLLVDRSLPGSGCSFGNSGAISENSITPIGMPGVLKQAPSMLLSSRSPLSVPFSYIGTAAPWLKSFVQHSSASQVTRIASVLKTFLAGTAARHRALMGDVGALDLLHSGGQLHVYTSERALQADQLTWRLRREGGTVAETLGRGAMLELEPALNERYQAAMYLPHQSWLADPYQYCQRIYRAVQERGGAYRQSEVLAIRKQPDGWQVLLGGDESIIADQVIVCSGVATRQLLQPLGLELPLISQRGYHLHAWSPNVKVNRIVALADRKAFISPMGDGLRIGGTVEFDDPAKPPNDKRAAHLAEHLQQAINGVNAANSTRWMGNRPCCPDSMPLIGSPAQHPGLWYAAGHGHLGLTGAANTGHLIAESIATGVLAAPLKPLSLSRFG